MAIYTKGKLSPTKGDYIIDPDTGEHIKILKVRKSKKCLWLYFDGFKMVFFEKSGYYTRNDS